MICDKTPKPQLYVLLLGLSLALSGCGDGRSEEAGGPELSPEIPSEPQRGGTVVIGFTTDIAGVNVLATGSTQSTTETSQRIFLSLLEEQPDFQEKPSTFLPRLAESWEFSEDHKVLTFHLREDTVWSDGVPITAADVRWTWQAQTSPEVSWDNVVMKSSILDVEVVDDNTVRFHFTHAYPGQLLHANEGPILPQHVWGKLPFSEWRSNGQWFVDNLVVSGPFDLEAWKPQQEIILRRNEHYYEAGLPYVERAILRIVPDGSSQLTQLLGGGLDFVRQVPAALADEIAANPRTQLVSFWPPQFTTVIWNLRNPLFAEASVRRGLTLAIDRQTIVDTIWSGYARTSSSPYISSVWGHNDEIVPLPYAPNQAGELLAAAGWRDSDGDGVLDQGGKSFTFKLIVNAGNQERVQAAEMVQAQLRQIGVAVEVSTLDWNTIGTLLEARNFDATITGLSVETSLDLSTYLHSESNDRQLNLSSYANAEVDELLEAARSQLNLEDSKPYLFRIQEILQQEQPMTILWEPQRLVGLSRRVQGAKPNAIATLQNLHEWWLLAEN